MQSYSVIKYSSEYKNQWDEFVNRAKNATFLFYRDFMEYHADRYEDFSLLIFKGKKLTAILPGNIEKNTLHSHQGLSYGGLVFAKRIVFKDSLAALESVLKFLEEKKVVYLQINPLPNIYSILPSEEIDYLLFLTQAKLIRRDLSATISQDYSSGIQSSNRRQGVKKAIKNNLKIQEQSDFSGFWKDILVPNLQAMYNESPVHSYDEIQLLKNRFPNNIRLFNVFKDNEVVAGCVIFETEKVAHVQYISSNTNGRAMSALDLLFDHLIYGEFKEKRYFDFGVSNENQGRNINAGLLFWKESFGARGIVHDFYEIPTANHTYLKNVFL